MGKSKITIIEGENVEQARKNAYEYLFKLIVKKLKEKGERDK